MNYYRGRPRGTMRSALERGDSRKFRSFGIVALTRGDSGITIDVGVSQWNDLEASAHHFVQATGANQFTVSATGSKNGRQVLVSDGVDDTMFAAFTYNQPAHIFLNAKWDAAFSADDTILCGHTNVLRFWRSASNAVRIFSGGSVLISSAVTPQAWHIHEMYFEAASSFYNEDGSQKIAPGVSVGTGAGTGIRLATYDGTLTPTAASYAQVLAFSSRLQQSEASRVKAAMAAY